MIRHSAFAAVLALAGFGASQQAAAQRLPDPSFDLVNNTPRIVEQLYANPVEIRDWGHDRLGTIAIPPGVVHRVRLDPRGGCLQDVRVVFRDGGVQDYRGFDGCAERRLVLDPAGPPPGVTPPGYAAPGYGAPGYGGPGYGAPPQGYAGGPAYGAAPGYAPQQRRPATLRIDNRGRRPIEFVFVSPSGRPDWGEDRLLGRTLRAGGSVALPLPPGDCIYDVKIVYADGAPQEQRGVDLCARPALRFP
ncbi:hypothetical protein [Pseudoroseomonas cervicalis]|uniref:hypothetical protein n=1 Tax=Teichococcus cervicalis TaxID=204525 RepID=UPI0027826FDD|nr:hypothetical protein [Pseudoroseomonas cervicalis]MDQ1081746.1 hypothetical protein [Pseudoroseomonas cervicalis]